MSCSLNFCFRLLPIKYLYTVNHLTYIYLFHGTLFFLFFYTNTHSCLHSVRTLRLKEHPLLEDDGEMFRIRNIHMVSRETISRVLSVYQMSQGTGNGVGKFFFKRFFFFFQ